MCVVNNKVISLKRIKGFYFIVKPAHIKEIMIYTVIVNMFIFYGNYVKTVMSDKLSSLTLKVFACIPSKDFLR